MSISRVIKRLSVVLLLTGVVFLGGCNSEPVSPAKDSRTNARAEKSTESQSRRLVLAVHPYASPVELTRQFAPLVEYLGERVGIPFTLLVSENYETHIARVGGNEVDVALMGPASYVTMSEQFGKKCLLCCFEINGSSGFYGYIIARKDNPATSLKDLQGKSFAASNRKSTMSYVVPRYMFIQARVPFPDAYLRIVNSHNNVCLNVLAGDVNAGGVREKAYLKYKNRDLKVIAVSSQVIEHPFVATDKLDAETYALVKAALLAIKGENQIKRLLTPIKSTLTGLVPVADRDYDQLRAMISAVRKDEKRSIGEGDVK